MAGSILSFKDRGKWGDPKWRGNCSGHIYAELFRSIEPKFFIDPMMGSGTSIEVAREMGIDAQGLDLHSGFDCLTMSIVETVGREADLVLSHPPYSNMVIYSSNVWGDNVHPNDLSHCKDDEDFNAKLQTVLLNQREATLGGGFYGTIIGDWRRDGMYSSYQAEAIARMPRAELAGVIIKEQHNQMSSRKTYGRMKLPFCTHEYILLWRKPKVAMSALSTLAVLAKEQSMRLKNTWRSLVQSVLMRLGGKAPLQAIYEAMVAHAPERLANNKNIDAKVRQTLQLHDCFVRVEKGVWALAT